jgi:tripartite ATP-independent transporter DctM subunit
VVKLYAAAIIPGFALAGLYVIYVITRATLNPSLCPKPKDLQHYSVLESILLVLKAFVPLAALIMAVLGSILFGLATPSEAAAMGALGGIILAVVYRAFSWQRLRESVYLTARTSAMVCFLFVGAATFSSVFSYLGGEHIVKDMLLAMDLTPVQFLLLAQLIIFILGWPLEWSEIIIIFVPIFLPLLPIYGVDPILFGILIAINLQTSFLTPPMAMSAYYLKGVAPKELELWTIFKGCFPFVGMVLLTLALTYIYPSMVTYLPDQFFNQVEEVPYDPNDESVVDPNVFKNM